MDDLVEHWKEECPQVKVKCPECEAKILRIDTADHNCGQVWKAKYFESQQKIEALKHDVYEEKQERITM